MSKEQAELRRWLEEVTDPELSAELLSIRNEEKEVHERFYRSLEFGTGGLRGELGAGTNRMNIYTVRQATQGFAAYLLTQEEKPSAAISYDSRHQSDVFARETARVLAANGIKVYLYPHLMPTPALSFAVLDRHCTGGVMVTASHNPARYNGYKAYAADGAQISGHVAAAVSEEIEKTDIFRDVKLADFEEALADGRIEYIGDALIERYYAAVMAQALRPELGKAAGLRLVYTPLNGSGLVPVMTVLKRMGHTDITVVPEQEQPNGDFPTCPYPNPEILEAMQLGLNLCEKLGGRPAAGDRSRQRPGGHRRAAERHAPADLRQRNGRAAAGLHLPNPAGAAQNAEKPRRRPQYCFHHHDRRHRGALWCGDAAGADRV